MMRQRGFTLIELLVALAVAAIVAAVVVPSFSGFLARQQAAADVNQVISAFSFARSEAVKRRADITADLQQNQGKNWVIEIRQGDDVIRKITGSSPNVSLTPTPTSNKEVIYGALGGAQECRDRNSCEFKITHTGEARVTERTIRISATGSLYDPDASNGDA